MNPFTEDNLVEQTVIKLIKEVWGDGACHINAYTDAEDLRLGRGHRGEVVLEKFLLPALSGINSRLPQDVLMQAVEQLTRDRSHLSLVNANHEIYKILRDGANVQVPKGDGSSDTERVRFIDFENAGNNHFLCVSQFWVVGEMYARRADVVLFVNGIPPPKVSAKKKV
jgi:type I restriction enzyme R subunit